MYVGHATREQASQLFRRFFPDASFEVADWFAQKLPLGKVTMSALQTHLLMYADDLDGAIAEVEDMVASVAYGWDPASPNMDSKHPKHGQTLGETDGASADTDQVAIGCDK